MTSTQVTTPPTQFMRIPFFVGGYPVTEDNMDDIATWCEGHVIRDAENPFVRVPVNRATNKRQTEAYAGMWVIVSIQNNDRSFKVYTEEWLHKQFVELPPGALNILEVLAADMTMGQKTPIPPSRPVAGIPKQQTARPQNTQRQRAS